MIKAIIATCVVVAVVGISVTAYAMCRVSSFCDPYTWDTEPD